jgi:Concanavalin A-like lectin/glucanases superfamily
MVLRTLRVALAAAALSLAIPAAANAGTLGFPLEGWWPLNEGSGQTVRDWSGNNNNGYLGTTTGVDDADPGWVDGVWWGSSLRFYGEDRVTIPASASLQPQRLTVDVWVRYKQSEFGSATPGIFKYPLSMGGNGCDVSSYGFVTDVNEGLQFYIASNGQYIVTPSAPKTMWDGNWHNVAGTFDGSKVRMYLDGVQMGSGTAVPAGTKIDYSLATQGGAIGGYAGDCTSRFLDMRGDVDGVQIWSTAVPVDTVWKILKSLFTGSR